MDTNYIANIVNIAIKEDLGAGGDITSDSIFVHGEQLQFTIVAREDMVFCGVSLLNEVFRSVKMREFHVCVNDGDVLHPNARIAFGRGDATFILAVERVALNLVQYASGIASLTREFVDEIAHTKAKIRDTRKTAPGLRELAKYAVGVGGGWHYRCRLDDGILIKDNHIACCGSISEAVLRVRKRLGSDIYIAVECDEYVQVEEAVLLGIDMILLDNMGIDGLMRAVNCIDKRALVEASGGVRRGNVLEIANTGVDYISIGALTHSAPAKDIGLDVAL